MYEWIKCLAYTHVKPETKALLNTVEDLMPVEPIDDRYSRLGQWLRKARKEGLLTTGEYMDVRYELAQLI